MSEFTQIISITLPLFMLIGLGYQAAHQQWITKDKFSAFGWFVVNLGLPAALFSALSSRSTNDIFHLDYLLVYGLGSTAAFAIIFFFARIFLSKSVTEGAFFGLGASASNSVLIGFPVIEQAYGDAALVPFVLTLMVENLIVLPLALALAETGQKQNLGFFPALFYALLRLLKNPIIIAIVLGMLSAFFDFQPPNFIQSLVEMLAASVSALALFAIGGNLVGFKPAGLLKDIALIVLGKLVCHPTMIMLMLLLMPSMPKVSQHVAVIMASMPMFSIFVVLGSRYSLGSLCAAVLVPATVLSFLTINMALWLLR